MASPAARATFPLPSQGQSSQKIQSPTLRQDHSTPAAPCGRVCDSTAACAQANSQPSQSCTADGLRPADPSIAPQAPPRNTRCKLCRSTPPRQKDQMPSLMRASRASRTSRCAHAASRRSPTLIPAHPLIWLSIGMAPKGMVKTSHLRMSGRLTPSPGTGRGQ